MSLEIKTSRNEWELFFWTSKANWIQISIELIEDSKLEMSILDGPRTKASSTYLNCWGSYLHRIVFLKNSAYKCNKTEENVDFHSQGFNLGIKNTIENTLCLPNTEMEYYENFLSVFGFVRCCYILAPVLHCFRLMKGRAIIFDLKQLFRVSCILWCSYLKCHSIIIVKNS